MTDDIQIPEDPKVAKAKRKKFQEKLEQAKEETRAVSKIEEEVEKPVKKKNLGQQLSIACLGVTLVLALVVFAFAWFGIRKGLDYVQDRRDELSDASISDFTPDFLGDLQSQTQDLFGTRVEKVDTLVGYGATTTEEVAISGDTLFLAITNFSSDEMVVRVGSVDVVDVSPGGEDVYEGEISQGALNDIAGMDALLLPDSPTVKTYSTSAVISVVPGSYNFEIVASGAWQITVFQKVVKQ